MVLRDASASKKGKSDYVDEKSKSEVRCAEIKMWTGGQLLYYIDWNLKDKNESWKIKVKGIFFCKISSTVFQC